MTVRSAIKVSLLMQVISKVTSFAFIIVIVRLLTPEELGVFAIVSSLTVLAVDLRFFGTGNFLIKEQEVTEDMKRSVLGVSIVISYLLGLALFFGASSLSNYFEYPDMTLLFQLMSFSFFVAPFVVVPHSLLMKEYNFKSLLIITCVSQIISVLITLYLITLGFSYFSLAITMNVTVIIQLILTYFLASNHLVLRPSLKQIKSILNYGGFNSLAVIFTRLSYVAPDLIIGKMGTAREVAMYSRGLGFMDFLSQVLTMGFRPIALPYLSESIHNKADVNSAYLRATNLLGSICWPIIAVAAFSAYPIIVFLFGDQWVESVPIVAYLGVWMVFKMLHILAPALLLASNNQKLLFYQTASVFVITALAIAGSFKYGLIAVAQAMALVGIIEFILISYQLKQRLGLNILALLRSLIPNITLTLTCLLATYFLSLTINFTKQDPIFSLGLIALVNIPLWIILTKVLRLEIYLELKRAIGELR
jgi:O-antigen/teichoic acid export membrane protein